MAESNPLDSLPEVVALAVQVQSYAAVAQLALYTYDWLLSVSEEHEILSKAGLSKSNMVYFLSRIGEFGHQLTNALLLFVSMESCDFLAGILGMCSTVSVVCTSFLFLLRVRAVYLNSRFITILFGTFWLVTALLNVLQATSLRGEIIPGTQMCTYLESEHFIIPSISTFVAGFINDTLIFLAITFRLSTNAMTDESWRSRFLSVAKGKGLHRLSRSLLISGQVYYLAVIFFFSANLVVMVSPSIPTVDHFLTITTLLGFTNMMACRVFRGVALGMMGDYSVTGLSSTKIEAAMQLDIVPSAPPHCKSDAADHWIR